MPNSERGYWDRSHRDQQAAKARGEARKQGESYAAYVQISIAEEMKWKRRSGTSETEGPRQPSDSYECAICCKKVPITQGAWHSQEHKNLFPGPIKFCVYCCKIIMESQFDEHMRQVHSKNGKKPERTAGGVFENRIFGGGR